MVKCWSRDIFKGIIRIILLDRLFVVTNENSRRSNAVDTFYNTCFTWDRLVVRLSMTGLFNDIIIELVFIFPPSFSFSIRLPCTSELMCSLPKFAGTLIRGAMINNPGRKLACPVRITLTNCKFTVNSAV